MPTVNTSTATNQYNPAGMNAYNAFQPGIQSTLMQMVQNPLGNSYFQHQLAQQQAGAQQVGQRSQSNLLQNMRTGGGILSNSGGFLNAQLQRNNIANSGMQNNAFNSAMNSALQNRSTALLGMQAYQPLQTGQTTTQQQTGLGTWLPQVAGAALSAFTGLPMGGGGGGASAGSYANTMGTQAPQMNFGSGPPPGFTNWGSMSGMDNQPSNPFTQPGNVSGGYTPY